MLGVQTHHHITVQGRYEVHLQDGWQLYRFIVSQVSFTYLCNGGMVTGSHAELALHL